MVNVNLYGYLGKKLGSNWNLEVDSVFEIFEAIEANTNKINKYFRDFNKIFTHFIVFIDGKPMPSHLLKSPILKSDSKVEILPVIQGGIAALFIVLGVVLIIVSMVLARLLSPKEPIDVKTSSSVLGKIKNVLNRNIPVPLGYGRYKVGSAVVTNDIFILNGLDASSSKTTNIDLISRSII